MDRISSCATSNSSETRMSLSVPSRVANLSAIGRRTLHLFVKKGKKERERGETVTFIICKITTLPHCHSRLQLFPLRLTNREEPVPAPPSLFYLGSMSCGARR